MTKKIIMIGEIAAENNFFLTQATAGICNNTIGLDIRTYRMEYAEEEYKYIHLMGGDRTPFIDNLMKDKDVICCVVFTDKNQIYHPHAGKIAQLKNTLYTSDKPVCDYNTQEAKASPLKKPEYFMQQVQLAIKKAEEHKKNPKQFEEFDTLEVDDQKAVKPETVMDKARRFFSGKTNPYRFYSSSAAETTAPKQPALGIKMGRQSV